jgi:transcriptional regulator with XRE-family HTH domain
MHYDMKRMGRVIRKARENKSITQAALAEKIEVSIRTIIAVENGQRNPTIDTLYRLIQTLDIPADLIFRPDDMPATPEQEQFIREYLSAAEQAQRVAMAAARGVWLELRANNG